MSRGEFLSNLRKKRGLSQSDIASLLGYSPQLVSLWEKDKASPDLSVVGEYAKALSIDLVGFIDCKEQKDNGFCIDKSFDIKKFSSFIKQLRKEKGLTQSELAKEIGVNVKNIGTWENMSSSPSIDQFITLTKFFNLSYDELYFCYKDDSSVITSSSNNKNKNKYIIPILISIGALVIGGVATGIGIIFSNNRNSGDPIITIKDNLVIDKENNTAIYGYYPQSKVLDEEMIDSLNKISGPSIDNKYFLNNEYYEKYKNNWYKCDEIKWIILSSKENEYTLISEKLLDVEPFYRSLYERTIDGKTIYPTNYEYSDIRSWLNNTFYHSAFFLHNAHICSTEVDNSSRTTDKEDNQYICNNTTDKVFLLSYQEYNALDYTIRRAKNTEYNIAKGAYNDSGYGYHWTRSPYFDNDIVPWCINQTGYLYTNYGGDVTVKNCGVRPCIVVKE